MPYSLPNSYKIVIFDNMAAQAVANNTVSSIYIRTCNQSMKGSALHFLLINFTKSSTYIINKRHNVDKISLTPTIDVIIAQPYTLSVKFRYFISFSFYNDLFFFY